jgi:hypothetical protein
MGAVVMVNANDGYPLLREIERAIAEEYHWPDFMPADLKETELPPKELEKFAGKYISPKGLEFVIKESDGKPLSDVRRTAAPGIASPIRDEVFCHAPECGGELRSKRKGEV